MLCKYHPEKDTITSTVSRPNILEVFMAQADTLKKVINLKTLYFFLIGAVTAGVYPTMWIYKYTPEFNKEFGKKILPASYAIWIAVMTVWGSGVAHGQPESIQPYAGLFGLVGIILLWVWCFKMRSALREYAQREFRHDFKMFWLWTLLFNVYHINYCVNALPEEINR